MHIAATAMSISSPLLTKESIFHKAGICFLVFKCGIMFFNSEFVFYMVSINVRKKVITQNPYSGENTVTNLERV